MGWRLSRLYACATRIHGTRLGLVGQRGSKAPREAPIRPLNSRLSITTNIGARTRACQRRRHTDISRLAKTGLKTFCYYWNKQEADCHVIHYHCRFYLLSIHLALHPPRHCWLLLPPLLPALPPTLLAFRHRKHSRDKPYRLALFDVLLYNRQHSPALHQI